MNLNGMNAMLAAQELTLGEKGIASAKVILTGFVVVFTVLLLLIAIIKIYSSIVNKAQNAGSVKKQKKTKAVAAPSTPAAVSAPPSAPAAPSVEDGVPEEVVAVIAAAVAAACGPQRRVRIKSIKKSGAGRSAWANAGILENTRPF